MMNPTPVKTDKIKPIRKTVKSRPSIPLSSADMFPSAKALLSWTSIIVAPPTPSTVPIRCPITSNEYASIGYSTTVA